MDRGTEGVEAHAGGGTGGNHLIQAPVQPFLHEARDGDGRLAVVLTGGEGERHPSKKTGCPPFQVYAQSKSLLRRPVQGMG